MGTDDFRKSQVKAKKISSFNEPKGCNMRVILLFVLLNILLNFLSCATPPKEPEEEPSPEPARESFVQEVEKTPSGNSGKMFLLGV